MSAPAIGGAPTAAVAQTVTSPPSTSRRAPRPKSGAWGRWVILAVAAIYFLGPLLIAFLFTVQNHKTNTTTHKRIGGPFTLDAYTSIFAKAATGQQTFSSSFKISIILAVLTIVLTLAVMLPTMLLIHLRYPKVRAVVEILSLFPLVFPPVVLVVGVSDSLGWMKGNFHGWSISFINNRLLSENVPLILVFLYMMLSLPFVFRALDAGIRSIDSRTLVEASRNLGAGWFTTLFRVLIPSLRSAIVNATFLCFALVMGEYTIASILLFHPFPVWLVNLPTTSGQVQSATSVLSLFIVEALLLIIGAVNGRRNLQAKG
jgi:putative spermidine/putrescine transport system permease protein